MEQRKIIMSETAVNDIERAQYEIEALENLIIKFMTDDGLYNRNSEAYADLIKKYAVAFHNLEVEKGKITDTLVPEEWKAHRISWQIDFPSKTLIITRHCECEI